MPVAILEQPHTISSDVAYMREGQGCGNGPRRVCQTSIRLHSECEVDGPVKRNIPIVGEAMVSRMTRFRSGLLDSMTCKEELKDFSLLLIP